jgi:hypothetical protein
MGSSRAPRSVSGQGFLRSGPGLRSGGFPRLFSLTRGFPWRKDRRVIFHPVKSDTLLMVMTCRTHRRIESPELWMPERNEYDTKFVRVLADAPPTKKHPQSVSELSIVQQRKKLFKDLVKGGNETQTLSYINICIYIYEYIYMYT